MEREERLELWSGWNGPNAMRPTVGHDCWSALNQCISRDLWPGTGRANRVGVARSGEMPTLPGWIKSLVLGGRWPSATESCVGIPTEVLISADRTTGPRTGETTERVDVSGKLPAERNDRDGASFAPSPRETPTT